MTHTPRQIDRDIADTLWMIRLACRPRTSGRQLVYERRRIAEGRYPAAVEQSVQRVRALVRALRDHGAILPVAFSRYPCAVQ